MKHKRVVFLGSKPLGLKCLEAVHALIPESLTEVVTCDDRADQRNCHSAFESFCKSKSITFHTVKNKKENEEVIKKISPDHVLVVGWYWLLSDELLISVPEGFIGIHNSLLPKYRGGSPLNWAILNNEKNVGLSLFSFSTGMDDGDIWAQTSVDITPEEYISEILSKLEKAAVRMLEKTYPKILDGTLKPIPQDSSKATYCAQRIPEDGLIHWDKTSDDIFNLIRATAAPYPGAFFYLNGKKISVSKAHKEEIVYLGTPGQVARVTNQGVYVIAGDQKPLILETLEVDGKVVKANEVLNSIKLRM